MSEDHILVCEICRGTGIQIIKGDFRNTVETCPECKGGERYEDNFKLTRGIPVPKDVLAFRKQKSVGQKMKFPWRRMKVGDYWEHDIKSNEMRAAAVTSLRRFEKNNPGFYFVYKLTNDRETGERGIEVWRVSEEDYNGEEGNTE